MECMFTPDTYNPDESDKTHCKTLNKGQISSCLLPPLLPANTITAGGTVRRVGTSERDHRSHPARALLGCQQAVPAPGTRRVKGKTGIQGRSGLYSQQATGIALGTGCGSCSSFNARGQELLFCPLARCLTGGEPQPDGGLRGSSREVRNTTIQQHRSGERQRRLQGGLSFHLPVSHLHGVSCLLLITLFSSPSRYSIPSCRRLTYACNLKLDRRQGNCFL